MRARIEERRPGSARQLARRAGLGDAASDAVHAELVARFNGAGSQAQNVIGSAVGSSSTQNARVGQGAQAAASLIQTGFNPDSQDDQQKLVTAIAGGMALIAPPAGPMLAAATEAIYQIGRGLSCPVTAAFASIGLGTLPPECGGKVCQTSGNWTPAGILADSGVPTPPRGSFASFVLGALAVYSAKAANCQGGFDASDVVDAAVNIWNQVYGAPSELIFVPPLSALGGPLIPRGQSLTLNGKNVPDPNLTYAFQPVSALGGSAWPVTGLNPSNWTRDPPFPISNWLPGYTPPRAVRVHTRPPRTLVLGPLVRSSAQQAASTQAASTAKTVAIAGAGTVAAVAVAGSAWALLENQTLGYFWGKAFDKAWDSVKGLFGK